MELNHLTAGEGLLLLRLVAYSGGCQVLEFEPHVDAYGQEKEYECEHF